MRSFLSFVLYMSCTEKKKKYSTTPKSPFVTEKKSIDFSEKYVWDNPRINYFG